jgi:DNA-binding CsgD family transcriptional regulator
MTPVISPREREVLFLIAHENTSEEIAQKLCISNHTAKSHRKNLLEKLSVRNMAGLVRRGFELGIISLEGSAMVASAQGGRSY